MIGAEIQESLRKRLVTAVTEICRNETFYNDEMKIEGTICIISDKNSFVVFQITELVGAGVSDDAAIFENGSNNNNVPYNNDKNIISNLNTDNLLSANNLNNKNNNTINTFNNCNIDGDHPAQNDLNLSLSFSSNPDIFNNIKNSNSITKLNNTHSIYKGSNKSFLENLSLSNTNLFSKNKKIGNFIRKRRRMIYNKNNKNSDMLKDNPISNNSITDLINNNNNIQDIINSTNNNPNFDANNIKQELPDFEYESPENLTLLNNLNNIDSSLNNTQQNINIDDNSTSFSSRCFEEIYIRTPHGIYRYLCKLCNSMFKIRNGLFEHLNGHFGRRPHACRQCDARFAHHSSLHNHVRNKHSVQTEEEKLASLRHVCPSCGRRFRYPSELERHKAVHEEFPINPSSPSKNNLLPSDLSTNAPQQHQPVTSVHEAGGTIEFQMFDHINNMSVINDGMGGSGGNSGGNSGGGGSNFGGGGGDGGMLMGSGRDGGLLGEGGSGGSMGDGGVGGECCMDEGGGGVQDLGMGDEDDDDGGCYGDNNMNNNNAYNNLNYNNDETN